MDAGLEEVVTHVDLCSGFFADGFDVISGTLTSEPTFEGCQRDAVFGRAAAIIWVIHVAAFAVNDVFNDVFNAVSHNGSWLVIFFNKK